MSRPTTREELLRRCDSEFEVTPQLYHAVAECPDCGLAFVIKPPGTPGAVMVLWCELVAMCAYSCVTWANVAENRATSFTAAVPSLEVQTP